jgi:hypothetical protein
LSNRGSPWGGVSSPVSCPEDKVGTIIPSHHSTICEHSHSLLYLFILQLNSTGKSGFDKSPFFLLTFKIHLGTDGFIFFTENFCILSYADKVLFFAFMLSTVFQVYTTFPFQILILSHPTSVILLTLMCPSRIYAACLILCYTFQFNMTLLRSIHLVICKSSSFCFKMVQYINIYVCTHIYVFVYICIK